MGSSLATLKDLKKVVIVGGSFAGQITTKLLQRFDTTNKIEITVVDKSAHFEFNCSNYKSLCEEETFKQLAEPFENIMKIYNLDSSKVTVKFVQGRLDAVNEASNSVTLKGPEGADITLEYDALVIATGATCGQPWRDGPEEMKTMEERDGDYKTARDAIKQAKSVLVGGAGATGLESAGYIKEKYPDHKVGVCLRGKTILPYIPGAHQTVVGHFKKLGIEIHYDTPYEGEVTAASLGYDYQLDCRGYKFTSPSKFMVGDLRQCLNPDNGQI